MKHSLSLLVPLLLPFLLAAEPLDKERLKKIDGAVEAAIQKGDVPGAVVLVVHNDEIVYRKAYGLKAKKPAEVAMTADTIFDLASCTKPVATGTSIMLLIEQGKIKLSDKVSTHWPDFAANGKEDVTVEHCLLHISGLTADNAVADYALGKAAAFKNIANLKLEAPAGTRFKYSDVGFIVLGHLVEKIGGQSVDAFAKKNVFDPLKMVDTGYNPAKEKFDRVAPTGLRKQEIILGQVHDPRAFALDGVAGHAGLFGTADDLAIYCRMLMNGGKLGDAKILAPLTVKLFTEGMPVPPKGQRSPGWDVDTSYSSQRGELFPAGDGFGHTGFTGTSIWVDPPSKTAIIILSNRVHPNDKGNATEMRRAIGTIVAGAIPDIGTQKAQPKKKISNWSPVETGLDVMFKQKFELLKGKSVALVTNQTGRHSVDGASAIDLMHKAEGVKLVALFSPEHGIRGELDEKVGDGKDEKTGLPVYSLYGERRKPTAAQLKGVDVIVYDIQDIGCRFYTFISTLGLILEAAKENNLPVIVLDRPNPIGGVLVEGPIRDAGKESFVAFHDIPVRHGMTVGELAHLFNAERKLDVKLKVVTCEGWRRGDTFDRTGLPWRNPSPNMRHLSAAMLYPGIGLLETTNISVGRGTERPFEWFGAPYIDGRVLAEELNKQSLPGVRLVPTSRTPVSSTFKEKSCGGVDILIDDWDKLRPVSVGLAIAVTLKKLYPNDWQTKGYDRLLVHAATLEALNAGKTASEIEKLWQPELAKFRDCRAKYLLYAD